MEAKINEAGADAAPAAAIFCRDADLRQFLNVLERTGRPVAAAAAGGLADAARWCTAHQAPGMIVADISGEAFPVPAIADLAATAGPNCRIVAVGAKQDVDLYRSLLLAGVFDYLASPVSADQIAMLLERAAEDRWLGLPETGSVRVGQTIALTGAAGGAGVSTIAALLGRALADKERVQTVLVDFDRRKGDLALMLGTAADNGLSGILNAPQIDYRLIERTVLGCGAPKKGEPERLKLLAQRPGAEAPVDPAVLLELGAALCELFSVSLWDIPSHRPQGSLDILANADVCGIVFDATVANARAAKLTLAELGAPQPGQRRYLILNRCREGKGGLGKAQLEEFLGAKIDVALPYAGRVLDESLLTGALSCGKSSEFGAAVEGLARVLLGREAEGAKKPPLLQGLKRLPGLSRLMGARA